MPVGMARAAPLSLQACKSSLAHSEACAGIVGLSHAMAAACSHQSNRLVHLRTLSPHCESIVEAAGGDFTAPRTVGPLASARKPLIAAVNSFAYQVRPCRSLACEYRPSSSS